MRFLKTFSLQITISLSSTSGRQTLRYLDFVLSQQHFANLLPSLACVLVLLLDDWPKPGPVGIGRRSSRRIIHGVSPNSHVGRWS